MEFEPIPERRPAPGAPARRRPPRSRRSRWGLLWRWAWVGALLLGTASGVLVAAVIHMPEVATLDEFQPELITSLFDREGEVIRTYAVENRILLREDEIPEVLRHAIVAVEDARFYHHGGIDLEGVLRAAVTNIKAGSITEGASTLTMQLAENLYHTRGKDWRRKAAEALLAVEIEKRYSKPQILTLYANLVYMGGGQYGMEAAARHYFNKGVGELTLPEAATLAGIPQRPNAFNAHRNPSLVTERRNHVLGRMLQEGFIDEATHRAAVTSPLLVTQPRRENEEAVLGAYFAEDVRRDLETRYGAKRLYGDGLQVHSTLDPRIQRATERALRRQLLALDHAKGWRGPTLRLEDDEPESHELPSWRDTPDDPSSWREGVVLASSTGEAEVRIGDERHTLTREGIAWTRKGAVDAVLSRGDVAWFRFEGDEGARRLVLEQEPVIEAAAVVLESSTGAVRAMVGGWDFERSKFNRASQAQRQVGSAFKPLVYAAAVEHGFTAADTILDAPVALMGADARASYRPRNYQRRHEGIITLRRALERSINVPAVKLLDIVGVERVIDVARRLGIESPLPPYPSLALGSADLVPLELAAAYAAIANQGLYLPPYLIERITTSDGRVLEEHLPAARKALEPEVAYVVTHMLEGVVDRGTAARLASLDVDLAGKTGTTNDYTDAWFVGYTPRYTLLVWVGYDRKRTLGYGMTGGAAALPIWQGIAEAGLEDGWIELGDRFSPPGNVSLTPVEYFSGLLAQPGSGVRTVNEAFVRGTEPTRFHDAHRAMVMSLPWYQQLAFYIPKEGEAMPGGRRGGGESEQVAEAGADPDVEAIPGD